MESNCTKRLDTVNKLVGGIGMLLKSKKLMLLKAGELLKIAIKLLLRLLMAKKKRYLQTTFF